MKKLSTLFIIAIFSLCFAVSSNAQVVRFGLKGGANLSQVKSENIINANPSSLYSGFNAGIVLSVRLGVGFFIQPELIYSRSGVKFGLLEEDASTIGDVKKTVFHSTVELPVNIQWGLKFGTVRTYIQVSPYVGYSLTEGVMIGGGSEKILDMDKLQYGVGAGVGIDIWRFQISYRYKWDINSLNKNITIEDIVVGAAKMRSSEISLAFFF